MILMLFFSPFHVLRCAWRVFLEPLGWLNRSLFGQVDMGSSLWLCLSLVAVVVSHEATSNSGGGGLVPGGLLYWHVSVLDPGLYLQSKWRALLGTRLRWNVSAGLVAHPHYRPGGRCHRCRDFLLRSLLLLPDMLYEKTEDCQQSRLWRLATGPHAQGACRPFELKRHVWLVRL
jgi:hypothetical protein